jgi:hypothetical protein
VEVLRLIGYPVVRQVLADLGRRSRRPSEIDLGRDARAGGCRQDVWFALADALADVEPWEAMIICREQVEPTIERKTKADYRDATDLLAKIRDLMVRTGDADEFPAYLAEIRERHKRKRNLIKLVVELDGGS